MARRQDFEMYGKCKHWHCRLMSNSAWTDKSEDCAVLKVDDMCGKNGCKCQKQLKFSARQYMLEGGSIKSNVKKSSKGTEKTWKTTTIPEQHQIFIELAISNDSIRLVKWINGWLFMIDFMRI